MPVFDTLAYLFFQLRDHFDCLVKDIQLCKITLVNILNNWGVSKIKGGK